MPMPTIQENPTSAYPTPWGKRPREPSVISLRNHFLPFE